MMDTKTNIPNNTEMTPVISLKGVSKWYGDFQALSNIDLEIKLKRRLSFVVLLVLESLPLFVALIVLKLIKRAQFMLVV